MRQYTTPLHTLFIKGFELADTDRVFVTYSVSKMSKSIPARVIQERAFTIDDPVITLDEEGKGTWIEVHLTQEQTGIFEGGDTVGVQVNWVTQEGERFATNIYKITSKENLLKEVIT